VTTSVVAVAQLGRRKQAPRGAMGEDEVRLILLGATDLVDEFEVEPAAAVALSWRL
jgi:hypothetical protein